MPALFLIALLMVPVLTMVHFLVPAYADGSVAQSGDQEEAVAGGSKMTVDAVLPEDVLAEEGRTALPEFKEWDEPGGDMPVFASTSNSSAGAIPAVKPFNFGRDPGGPSDKTLYLTVPKLGLTDVAIFDSVSEEKLKESAIHVPATGFPWQGGANTYIAGHRIGYPGTGSSYIFYNLDELTAGDEILLKDSAGGKYVYHVTEQKIVGPDNVDVMNPAEGKSLLSLQSCTLPHFAERLVVQGELSKEEQG